MTNQFEDVKLKLHNIRKEAIKQNKIRKRIFKILIRKIISLDNLIILKNATIKLNNELESFLELIIECQSKLEKETDEIGLEIKKFLDSEELTDLILKYNELKEIFVKESAQLEIIENEHTRNAELQLLTIYINQEKPLTKEIKKLIGKTRKRLKPLLRILTKLSIVRERTSFKRWIARIVVLLTLSGSFFPLSKFNISYAKWETGAQIQSIFESVKKSSKREIKKTKVIAHRGYEINGMGNTMKSFKKGIKNGAQYIEIDVRKTKDDIIVVFHDETVDEKTNGNGKISNMTLKELKQLKTLTGEKIPTLNEVLSKFKNKTKFIIDVKQNKISQQTYKIIIENNLEKEVIIFGTYVILQEFKGLGLKMGLTALASRNVTRFLLSHKSLVDRSLELDCDYFVIPTAFLYQELIDYALESKLEVWSYGRDNKDDFKEKINRGISGLIVDHPEMAFSAINELLAEL